MILQPQVLRSDVYISKAVLLPEEEVISLSNIRKITHIYFSEGSFVNQERCLPR